MHGYGTNTYGDLIADVYDQWHPSWPATGRRSMRHWRHAFIC
jgi:hypothetical protein